mmetsp:Transcript_45186/g.102025  ORF Transcript_45186/g.102025 Transcript_45186/m.102025 type:complete len:510 (-) Transcript_45186:101-1630(-)
MTRAVAFGLLILFHKCWAELHCDVAVAGGGWAGVYFAYRWATHANSSAVCLFEASSRIGGRTYSVPIEGTEFTLDVGAYRFSPDMHLPGDLILKHFNFPTECYEPNCPPAYSEFEEPFMFNYTAPLRRIVNETTRLPSGYVTAIEAMVGELRRLPHAHVFTGRPVVDVRVDAATGSAVLEFEGGATVEASEAALLNLPRNRLLALPSALRDLAPRVLSALKCIVFDQTPDLFSPFPTEPTSALSKAYALYGEDAWWVTKLNLTLGEWPEGEAFSPVQTSSGIWLNLHFNDGPVAASADGGVQGFLEVYYDVTNETFFSSVATGNPLDPLGVVRATDSAAAASSLSQLHAALLEALAGPIAAAGVDPSSISPPSALVVGVWDRPAVWDDAFLGEGLTAPTKVYYAPEMSGDLAQACRVPGLTEDEYRSSALHPWNPTDSSLAARSGGPSPPPRVFVANNDFVAMNVHYMYGDWAEESLLMAERALLLSGIPKPPWLDADYYETKVRALAN